MRPAPVPYNELARLKELYAYGILDSEPSEEFEEIVKLASNICKVPMSLVTLIDANRQWYKAKVGIDGSETDREVAFCAHAIMGSEIFVIPDATKDERFADNPFVTGNPDVRFYAGVPLVSPEGGSMGTLCVIDTVPRDITDEQREILIVLSKQVVKLMELHKKNHELKALTALEQAQRLELERISAAQKMMMAILAHDMRGPLGGLKGLFDLNIDPQKFTSMATAQINTSLSLLDNIVEWGQLRFPGDASDGEVISLHALVQEVLDASAVMAAVKDNKLLNLVDASMHAQADQYAIRFILRNLLTNAIKFTSAGTISVNAGLADNHLTIKVQDTGIGMTSEMAGQLFHTQRKTSRKGTNNEAGSGLGLSLVKEFIDNHHGSIQVESECGKGTTITFTLHL